MAHHKTLKKFIGMTFSPFATLIPKGRLNLPIVLWECCVGESSNDGIFNFRIKAPNI